MADEPSTEEQPVEEAPSHEKRDRIIKIAIIVAAVIVADVVAGFAIYKFAIPMLYKGHKVVTVKEDKKSGKEKEAGASVLKALESINLNPANSNGEILSTEIVIEAPQSVVDEITLREPQIRDTIQTYLSYKSVSELNDVTKRDLYKREILDKINAALKKGKATALYTKVWIIQFE
jgi:flagellar basal body-associated protein FliL